MKSRLITQIPCAQFLSCTNLRHYPDLVKKPIIYGKNRSFCRRIRRSQVKSDRLLEGVGTTAARFAAACGLSEQMIAALEEAGRLHDLGKNDPRFQLMLGAFDGRLLAKSGSHEVAVSRRLAGLARGWRHELASVAQCVDIDPIVRYLIGTHHGRGRPWLPATPDLKLWHQAQAADWPALATQMQQRYGFWGLCYLEGILRLADWARSTEEQMTAKEEEMIHAD